MTIREQLAIILTQHFETKINPQWLHSNYSQFWNGRNNGYAFSWSCEPDSWQHKSYGIGSCFTMTEFVRLVKQGRTIILLKDELLLRN